LDLHVYIHVHSEEELYNSYSSLNVISDKIKEIVTGGRVASRTLVECLEGMDSYDGDIIL
jgi:hypothetical protein